MNPKYQSIADVPHHRSRTHAPMRMADRGAQFAPFAALTGYDDAISETARLTDAQLVQGDLLISHIDNALRLLAGRIHTHPVIRVTYFVPDGRKTGGTFQSVTGALKQIDTVYNRLIFTDGTAVDLEDISEISE